ncbi:hypothetical protein [Mycolicibacterium moriokaense]|jgi:hypothetical protein|uniref:Uncharacterized protein n=1 Tax=Mycolicibacterium moriokaense TaxID=39691 RepID=A0AAD1HDQ8_9MYCO|nr:hypothetical protein [Mycolicibacterium moriokaense]MCV7038842.1 hypothetical protein [Mycolicibacterium moriokaense]BBX03547.1 hypothetical protein MMOR_44830 [Mycolicibacterium moriokaense]
MRIDLVEPSHTAIVTQECQGAVAGIPINYANTIIDTMLSLLATITTTDGLLEAGKPA